MLVGHDIFGFLYFVPSDSTYFVDVDRHMYREATVVPRKASTWKLEVPIFVPNVEVIIFSLKWPYRKQRDRNAQEIAMGKK